MDAAENGESVVADTVSGQGGEGGGGGGGGGIISGDGCGSGNVVLSGTKVGRSSGRVSKPAETLISQI